MKQIVVGNRTRIDRTICGFVLIPLRTSIPILSYSLSFTLNQRRYSRCDMITFNNYNIKFYQFLIKELTIDLQWFDAGLLKTYRNPIQQDFWITYFEIFPKPLTALDGTLTIISIVLDQTLMLSTNLKMTTLVANWKIPMTKWCLWQLFLLLR